LPKSPSIPKSPPFKPPYLNSPKEKRDEEKSELFPKQSRFQPKKYRPSGAAVFLGIKGKYSKLGELTDLGIRPILK